MGHNPLAIHFRQGDHMISCPQPADDPASIESLRDVIAACIFPLNDSKESKLAVEDTIKVALKENDSNPSLKEVSKMKNNESCLYLLNMSINMDPLLGGYTLWFHYF